MSEPLYTTDWFTKQKPDFEMQLRDLVDKDIQGIEIGSFEGRSTTWLMEHVFTHPSSRLTCIDTWEGSEEYEKMDIKMNDKFELFQHNISPYKEKIHIKRGMSQNVLRELDVNNKMDFIYVDGSHTAFDVLEDIILSWRILKPGGIMALDDYEWTYMNNARHEPKMGIDSFLFIWEGQYELLVKNWMVWVRKI